mmetsp:Transcript_7644/g.18002  ORF Transcript_7644/g.18002 Transcript_7644/m.18002 type:complete len:458 (+) Transcript_7644:493-1866(+)
MLGVDVADGAEEDGEEGGEHSADDGAGVGVGPSLRGSTDGLGDEHRGPRAGARDRARGLEPARALAAARSVRGLADDGEARLEALGARVEQVAAAAAVGCLVLGHVAGVDGAEKRRDERQRARLGAVVASDAHAEHRRGNLHLLELPGVGVGEGVVGHLVSAEAERAREGERGREHDRGTVRVLAELDRHALRLVVVAEPVRVAEHLARVQRHHVLALADRAHHDRLLHHVGERTGLDVDLHRLLARLAVFELERDQHDVLPPHVGGREQDLGQHSAGDVEDERASVLVVHHVRERGRVALAVLGHGHGDGRVAVHGVEALKPRQRDLATRRIILELLVYGQVQIQVRDRRGHVGAVAQRREREDGARDEAGARGARVVVHQRRHLIPLHGRRVRLAAGGPGDRELRGEARLRGVRVAQVHAESVLAATLERLARHEVAHERARVLGPPQPVGVGRR